MPNIYIDLILYYKIIHNIVDLHSEIFFITKPCGRPTRGNSLQLNKQKFLISIGRYSFKNRYINLWNKLPNAVINSCSVVKSFKTELNKLT